MRSAGPMSRWHALCVPLGGVRGAWPTRAWCIVPVVLGLAACGGESGSAGSPSTDRPRATAAPPLVAGPARPRATLVLLHGGGWAGPNVREQRALADFPGADLRARGYETVSLDYAAGKRGIGSVRRQLAALRRERAGDTICLYGESAGGNLALLAAADQGVACVMTLGAPTDFAAWRRAAAARAGSPGRDGGIPSDRRPISLAVYRQTALAIFGKPGAATRRFEPAFQAPRIRARTLLAQQADDVVVPRSQIGAYRRRARGTVHALTLPAGTPQEAYLHGTLSAEGRTRLVDRLVGLVAASR